MVGSIQPRIRWLRETLSIVVNRLASEADHSRPLSAAIKNAFTPPIRLHAVYRDRLYLLFT
jgi:hypothetical protein